MLDTDHYAMMKLNCVVNIDDIILVYLILCTGIVKLFKPSSI